MKSILAILVISTGILLIACSKDKFETKPKIEFKDYNTREIHRGQTLVIRLNYYDKEGDLNTGTFFGVRNRVNQLPLSPLDDKTDTLRYNIPDFPPRDHGEITYTLDWEFLKEDRRPPPIGQNDTLEFKFAVADLAGNKSDTITTPIVIVYMP